MNKLLTDPTEPCHILICGFSLFRELKPKMNICVIQLSLNNSQFSIYGKMQAICLLPSILQLYVVNLLCNGKEDLGSAKQPGYAEKLYNNAYH